MMPAKTRPCQRCGATIPAERVEALPETRLCIPCSQEVGGDFISVIKEENLAKTGSLKKNYGGVQLVKQRRRIVPKDAEE
jgi:hypothetical protein